MPNQLVDRIYEAAFVPDEWPQVLAAISDLSASASGAICLFSDESPVRGSAQENVRHLFEEFLAGDTWRSSGGIQRMRALQPTSFVAVEDFMTADEVEEDPVRSKLRAFGIGQHVCAAVPMPSGELVTFVFQRWTKDGAYDRRSIRLLDSFRPHLARAGLMAARLGLRQAQATASALQAIGLPAAVLSGNGCVRASNDLFDSMTSVFLPKSFGGMAIADVAANGLFRKAIEASSHAAEPVVRSIPVRPKEAGPLVIHIMPLRRSAHDIFSGADILVAATAVNASNIVPSPTLLSGLFDLAPAEAKLAAALATGVALKQAAAEQNIRTTTARHYLEQIFRKTGTHRQSELVALIKSTLPLHRAD